MSGPGTTLTSENKLPNQNNNVGFYTQSFLQWASRKERPPFPSGIPIDTDVKTGEFVLRTLFSDFTVQTERKIDLVLAEPLERPLSKSLQRGEDAVFDQLLSAFGSVAEHCLPSLLRTLFAWYDRQNSESTICSEQRAKSDVKQGKESAEKTEHDYLNEKRDLAVEFIFCLVLIEVLKQLSLHPGYDDVVNHVENLAFKHFRYREGSQSGPNAQNVNIIADLYAEVIGVVAQARFQSVRKCFTAELKELKSKDPSPIATQSIISLLMGMKFFRVKMAPIEEFEASFQFMQECANYFLEVKDKDIKHALAGLFVEILVPVAASVKNEVNVPCVKNFVEALYSHTLDLCTKKKHSLALFPLVTCLLCVSQKLFFLQNWHYFLAMCLSHLKNRDSKMSRVALESLYRLLWVYMIRIKCESNTATQSRLQSIVNSLFPKGSKAVVPRDTPLNIFVKIIQFVAQERLDFAMKEIVFDLMSVGRPIKIILTPERMNIGLRAFLVVADSLQQKEGEPPMPRTVGVLPSGNTLRVRKTFLNKMLTDDAARSIGVSYYYPHVRKAIDDILKALDIQFGRPLMMTTVQNINKEPDDMITTERKPKIDLFRTCVAAIPRLIPDGMSRHDLVDLLSRLTVHLDEELRGLAFQSLQNMMADFPDWREDVICGFIQFMLKEVNDTFPQLLDNSLRMLLQFLTNWKNTLMSPQSNSLKKDSNEHSKLETLTNVLHLVEAVALVMLCNCRIPPRRVAIHILREVKYIWKYIQTTKEPPVADIMDKACPAVVEKCLPLLPAGERAAVLAVSNVDLQWLAERSNSAWTSGYMDCSADVSIKTAIIMTAEIPERRSMDAWSVCLMGFLEEDCLPKHCTAAIMQSWPIVYHRITSLFNHLDVNPINDNRASLLRTAPVKKTPSEREIHLNLWRNYLMFACRIAPPKSNVPIRYLSPDLTSCSSPDSAAMDRLDSRSPSSSTFQASSLFKQIVPLLRNEQADMRDAVVLGLSQVNHLTVKDLMEEFVIYIREAIDRKQENMRRRRRRDILRVQLAKVMELIAERGTFGVSLNVLDRDAGSLNTTFVEYIDGARLYLESESDKDVPSIVQEIKQHFCGFIRKLIKSFQVENRNNLLGWDVRRNLFYLFSGWCGRLSYPISICDKKYMNEERFTEFDFSALQGMSAVLCCGPTFDPPGLCEESSIYTWLDNLLCFTDENIHNLAQETMVLLLEFNPDVGSLLDWLVDRCYTGSVKVADGCFNALATIFSTHEYPCDHYMAIINVTLMNTGCPRASIQETALELFYILYYRFFQSSPAVETKEDNLASSLGTTNVILRKKETKSQDAFFYSNYPCSQLQLSRQMAQNHPELTMTIFSEITFRFQTARPSVRQNLIQYLLPWLYNMELVDPNLPQVNSLTNLGRIHDLCPDGMQGIDHQEGWGSAEATEMVLNNLFYITVKFSNEHPKEIEDLWASLCNCWPNNLKVIIRYLFIVTGLAPNELLPFAKLVIVFMARTRPERLLDEMMSELQTVETLNCLIERTETPPFFRVTNLRKGSNHSEDGVSGSTHTDTVRGEISLEKGTLHTKRRSTQDGADGESVLKEDKSVPYSLGSASTISSKSERCYSSMPVAAEDQQTLSASVEEDNFILLCRVGEEDIPKPDTPQPHPLPMPEFGGYYAPLTEFLPESSQPVIAFHRCNLAVMLLTDVVFDIVNIDWSPHIPLMLHIIFLGLDHTRLLVHENCKKLLLNLLVVLAKHNDQLVVSRILLNNKTNQTGYGLITPNLNKISCSFIEPRLTTGNDGSAPNSTTNTYSEKIELNDNFSSIEIIPHEKQPLQYPFCEVVKSLIDFIASKKGILLWTYEDITAKVWTVRSAEQLTLFLHHVLSIFKESVPAAHIQERWAQVALQLALSCSSRHYAGRSLQIFRALKIPISARMLTDILSRLVETVAEQGEDMQGYVTELMLTLEAAIDSLDSEARINDFAKEFFKSTPNLSKEGNRRSAPPIASQSIGCMIPGKGAGHVRSTSYSISCSSKKLSESPTGDGKENFRMRTYTDSEVRLRINNLGRSHSAQSLKLLDDCYSQEDRMSLLSQFFWIAVSLLESDYEHEYLLALRLLEKVIAKLPLELSECQEKLEKYHTQMKWSNFPGVHAYLLKGCTSPSTFEPTMNVLSYIIPYLDIPVIDPSETVSFPFNVMALLPYMLLNYDDPNPLCIKSAESIAQTCMERSKKLENLATVMTLYSRHSFSKESFQWTKCIVKYLYDAYSHLFLAIITFLVEVLEKGPLNLNQHVLSILHCILHYIDVLSSAQAINADLLRVLSKYIEGPHWKDSLKILKLVVTRSSALIAPTAPLSMSGFSADNVSIASGTSSFSESEMGSRRELPGRTMEFAFDLSQTPIVGRRHITQGKDAKADNKDENAPSSPRRSLSHNHSFSENGNASCWKRPWLSQARTREHLIGLLTSCGQRVGLPKSPSVIFSQSSDIMDRQSSMCSSTEEVSALNIDISGDSKLEDSSRSEQHFGLFKDFDFLEYELEGQEGESMDNFNWGVRRRSLSNFDNQEENDNMKSISSTSTFNLSPRKEESSDDEMGSVSPLDDAPPELTTNTGVGLVFAPSLQLLEHGRRPSSPRSGSSQSLVSDGDLTLSNTSPSLSPMVAASVQLASVHTDDTESAWRNHVHNLMADSSGSVSANTYRILNQLFRETFRNITHLTRDSCHLFSMNDSFRNVASQFMTMVDILNCQVECPFIFIDSEIMLSCNLIGQHKYCALEILEHWETFLEKREHTMECIDCIKARMKLESLGEPVDEASLQEQRIDLCRCLYRLHFQLLLLLESYSKLLSVLSQATINADVVNLSQEVTAVKQEVVRSMEDTESDRLSPTAASDNSLVTAQEVETTLLEFIEERKWAKAIKHLSSYRSQLSHNTSYAEDDDIDILMEVYCQHLCENRSGYLVITQPEPELAEVCRLLMDISLQLSSLLHALEQAPTPVQDHFSNKS